MRFDLRCIPLSLVCEYQPRRSREAKLSFDFLLCRRNEVHWNHSWIRCLDLLQHPIAFSRFRYFIFQQLDEVVCTPLHDYTPADLDQHHKIGKSWQRQGYYSKLHNAEVSPHSNSLFLHLPPYPLAGRLHLRYQRVQWHRIANLLHIDLGVKHLGSCTFWKLFLI